MKKGILLIICAVFLLSTTIDAATGIFQTYIFLDVNGSSEVYDGDIMNPNNTDFTNFNGLMLSDPSSLVLTGAEAHTFKNGGGDVTGGRVYYRIYESGTAAPGYTTIAFGFSENCPNDDTFDNTVGGQCTFNSGDQKWNAVGQMVDLLAGISNNGTYNLDIYIEMDTNEGARTDGSSSEPLSATISFTTLPVELTGFTAQPNKTQIQLSWTTASEINNSHFEVERSQDSKTWSTVGKVKGNGTTLVENKYSFYDEVPEEGMNYYRLKQVDTDGIYEYSEVVAVAMESRNGISDVQIFPTLVEDQLTIRNGVGEAIIYNQLGQAMQTEQIADFVFQLNVSDLPSGQYILILHSETGQKTVKRFLK